jgi:hypothetical protein
MSSDIRLELTRYCAELIPEPSSAGSATEAVFGKICQASTLRSKLYVRLGEGLRTGEKEEVTPDIQEQEHIDCAG